MNQKCEYCCTEGLMENKEMVGNTKKLFLVICGAFLYSFCDCGRHMSMKIKYCPMCGRELE